jgi:hypothetical protein
MAVLNEADRADVWANWMRENDAPIAIVKADLRAAVDAIDDWVNSNAASFNTAIPLPARTSLSARQKEWILHFVIRRRFERS